MKLVELEQGSPEWLLWRKNHVTSTDAATIMGENPFCNLHTLWLRKHDQVATDPVNAAMLRGSELEPFALKEFIKQTGIEAKPAVGEHDNYSWMGTSLDGINEDGTVIVEIKSPMKLNKHLSLLDDNVVIDVHYQWQIFHHLEVSGADVCFFVSYHPDDPDKIIIKEVMPDKRKMEQMVLAEQYFWEKNILLMEPVEI